MQIYMGIHDRKSLYKHSCSLPILHLSINKLGTVDAKFDELEKQYITSCVEKLEGVLITYSNEITFNLKDYHFTTYIA